MAYRVLLTRRIPDPAMEWLAARCELEVNEADVPMSYEELSERLEGKDGLLAQLTDRVDAALLERHAQQLKGIANYAVGLNNIDLQEATRRGIPVSHTPGVLTETTADLAWALLMASARRIVEADAYIRSGRWQGWDPMLFLGTEVYGSTLGVVGFGRIGQAMARRAQGFGMKVLYYNRTRLDEEEERRRGVAYAALDDLLAEADFVSLHVPYTPATHHLISADRLRRMKPAAHLINTARGAVVEEAALVRALRERWIAGAGLDVFEEEPRLADGLAELPQVVLAPHIGSATGKTRERMGMMAAQDLLLMMAGKRPRHPANPELFPLAGEGSAAGEADG